MSTAIVTSPVDLPRKPARRLLHAYPEGSLVSLCGITRRPDTPPPVAGDRCHACEREAGRKHFIAR
jgi:hypothetical protein